MSEGRIPTPLHLGPVPEASSKARRYIRDELASLGADGVLDAAELGVSELVTNACLHARTSITVTVLLTKDGKIRIEVGDDSPRNPRERVVDNMNTTGRGLRLLSAYGRWGVAEPLDGRIGKTVWFEPRVEDDLGQQLPDLMDEWPDSL